MGIINMLESNEQAYIRGQKAATFWKRLKRVVSSCDRRCMAWVKNHKLPTWIGHVPVVIAVLGSLAGILLGGAVILGCLIFIWALVYILQQTSTDHMQVSNSSASDETGYYYDGPEGYGKYENGVRKYDE